MLAQALLNKSKHARAPQWGERQNSQRQDSMPSLHAAARAGGSSRDAMIDGHCKAEAEAEAENLKP